MNNLNRKGKNYSAGLMQINSKNFKHYGLDNNTVFDVCQNIKVGAKILTENYERQQGGSDQLKVRNALSRYYSGNDKRGYVKELNYDGKSYVERMEQKAYKVPALLPPDNVSVDFNESRDITTVKTDTNTIEKTLSWDVFGDFK